MSPSKTCKIIKAYRSAYPDPLIIKSGETLTIGEKESEWDDWAWCTNASSKSGWVPEKYLEIKGGDAVAVCDYDATELTVTVGEELVILHEESGWAWAVNQNNQTGWVPLECVAMAE